MFVTRRPSSRLDVSDYNTLLYRDYDANINFTKNYLLCRSPPPMTFRDLRSVMSNITPSNVVIVSETSTPSQIRIKTSSNKNHRKHSSRKKQKRPPVDVYRTLPRAESRGSVLGERDISNEELMLLATSFVIDHPTPAPTSGFFYPQNLPNIQKQRARTARSPSKSTHSSCSLVRSESTGQSGPKIVDLQLKENINRAKPHLPKPPPSSSATRIQSMRHTPPSPPQLIHRTTPVDIQYEDEEIVAENPQITVTITTAKEPSPLPEIPSLPEVAPRRQLHVYIPQIISC